MSEKKISFAEGLLMILFCIFADALEVFLGLLGLVPIITPLAIGFSWLINISVWGIIQFWFIIKGERGLWFLAGSLLEFIPFIGILPLRTATCALAIYLANHPQVASLASASKRLPVLKSSASENDNDDENGQA